MNVGSNFNNIYRRIILDLMENPDRIGTTRKGEKVYERFNYEFVLTDIFSSFCDIRPASWEYLEKEFQFYAGGSDNIEDAMQLSKFWSNCTDDGKTINSNYGKLLLHDRNTHGKTQIQHAIGCLLNNPDSKKAVAVIYGPEHAYMSNDNPCTMFLHFNIVDDKLHLTTYMRSNDIWFGTVYDVPYFCSILYAVHGVLQMPMAEKYGIKLQLGSYTHHACNLHMYERNREKLKAALNYYPQQIIDTAAIKELYNVTLDAVEQFALDKVVPELSWRDAILLAWEQADLSPCLKKQCGAVLVDENNYVIGVGYGGRDYGECKVCARDKGEVFYSDGCWSVHAEMRAILAALKNYPRTDWSKTTMFTTHGPCDACMKLMDYIGIGTCVYDVPYKTDYSHYPRVAVYEERVNLAEAGKRPDNTDNKTDINRRNY